MTVSKKEILKTLQEPSSFILRSELEYYESHIKNYKIFTYEDIWADKTFFPFYYECFENINSLEINDIFEILQSIKEPILLKEILYIINDLSKLCYILNQSIAIYSGKAFKNFEFNIQDTKDLLAPSVLIVIIKTKLQKEHNINLTDIIPMLKQNDYAKNLAFNLIHYYLTDLIFVDSKNPRFEITNQIITNVITVLTQDINNTFDGLLNVLKATIPYKIEFAKVKCLLLLGILIDYLNKEQTEKILISFEELIHKKNSLPSSFMLGQLSINNAHKIIANIYKKTLNSYDRFLKTIETLNYCIHELRFNGNDSEFTTAINFILVLGVYLSEIYIKTDEILANNLLDKIWYLNKIILNLFSNTYLSDFCQELQKYIVVKFVQNHNITLLNNSIIKQLKDTSPQTTIESLELIMKNNVTLDFKQLDIDSINFIKFATKSFLANTKNSIKHRSTIIFAQNQLQNIEN